MKVDSNTILSKFAGKDIKLHRKFPLSNRYVLKQTFVWLLIGAFLCLLFLWGQSDSNPFSQYVSSNAGMKFRIMSYIGLGILALKVLYSYLYQKTVFFGIRDDSFYLSKGIILRQRANFPLASITNTYIKRDFLDLVCGLSEFQLSTANEASDDFEQIPGLSSHTADKLGGLFAKLLQVYQVSRQDILGLQNRQTTAIQHLMENENR